MCIYIYVHIYVYIYMYICIYMCIYICVSIYMYIYKYVYIFYWISEKPTNLKSKSPLSIATQKMSTFFSLSTEASILGISFPFLSKVRFLSKKQWHFWVKSFQRRRWVSWKNSLLLGYFFNLMISGEFLSHRCELFFLPINSWVKSRG